MKQLLLIGVIALATISLPVHGQTPACSSVVYATDHGGSVSPGSHLDYWPSYGIGGGVYATNEIRAWLLFPLPAFTTSVTRAELRFQPATVFSPTNSETIELHSLATPPSALTNRTANPASLFLDLADGPMLGARPILVSEGSEFPFTNMDFGTLVSVPFTPAGLAALNAAAGQPFALGAVVSSLDTDPDSREALLFYSQPLSAHLVFSSAGETLPEVSVLSTNPVTALMMNRITVEAAVCGQQPMSLQWWKGGLPVTGATNEVLELFPSYPSQSGAYRLRASNALGAVLGPAVDVRVLPIQIQSSPQSQSVPAGQSATFYAYAYSPVQPLFIQWRHDGVPLSGEIGWGLILYDVTPGDAGDYDVVFTNPYGSVTSAVARLTVTVSKPTFTYFTAGGTVYLGGWLSLQANAEGTQPISYQWFKDNALLPGATDTLLRKTNVVAADAGSYFCVASNIVGLTTSATAQVVVKAIDLSGAVDATVLWGHSGSLSVAVYSGVPYTVQWFRGAPLPVSPLPGRTNAYLSFNAVQPSDAGQYFAIASNPFASITSRVATLTVNSQAPTASASVSSYSAGGTNLPDGVRVPLGGEVNFYGSVGGGPPPAPQWRLNGTNLLGQTNLYLHLSNLTSNHAGYVTLVATSILGSASSSPIRLEVVPVPPVFTLYPRTNTVIEGDTVTLHAYAGGGPQPTMQWRRLGADLPGETNFTLALQNVTTNDSGAWEVRAQSSAGQTDVSAQLNVRHATGLDLWNWRNPLPQGNRFKSAAWGAGRWVVTGNAGSILTSTNGTNWTLVVLDANADLEAVAFGNDVFVAAGPTRTYSTYVSSAPGVSDTAGVVFVSEDGLHWSVGHAPDFDSLQDIAFGGGQFIAAPYYYGRAFVYTSADGRNWTPQQLPWENTVPAARVGWGKGRFIAAHSSSIYESTNAVDWTRSLSDSSIYPLGVAANDDAIVVSSGGYGYVFTETAGWNEVVLTSYVSDVAAAPGCFVGLGSRDGHVLVSSNGFSWTNIDTYVNEQLETVAFGGGQFLVAGEGGTIMLSADGTNWSPNLVRPQENHYGLAHSPDLTVVVGDDGTILTSPDGRTWTPQASGVTGNLHAVHYADGLFVASGRNGTILTSTDGTTWTQQNSGTTTYLERICWADGLWVIVGERGAICTSTNGFNWTLRNTGSPYTDHEGIAYGNGVWVAAGGYFTTRAYSTAYYSTDGQTWLLGSINLGVRARDVAFGGGRFVLVANDGNWAVSTNGWLWERGLVEDYYNFRRVHYANGHFTTVGNEGRLFSLPGGTNWLSNLSAGSSLTSGLTWTKHRSRTTVNLHDIHAGADGRYFTVGNQGAILQSGPAWPQLRDLRFAGGQLVLQLEPGLVPSEALSLQASTDLRTWLTIATNLTPPIVIPATNAGGHFFRLFAP
ncbi:MAG: immunoglobulin domain-containing protein [Verrucomicrobia bacterium]|nr:immunoglobulin domain-containing protein [Verrucomicrobiota bacterium]